MGQLPYRLSVSWSVELTRAQLATRMPGNALDRISRTDRERFARAIRQLPDGEMNAAGRSGAGVAIAGWRLARALRDRPRSPPNRRVESRSSRQRLRAVAGADRRRGVAGQELHVAAERAVQEVALPAQPIHVLLIVVAAQVDRRVPRPAAA